MADKPVNNIVKIEDAIIRKVVRDDRLGDAVQTNVQAILGQLDIDRLIADPKAELDAVKDGMRDAFHASVEDYFHAGRRYAAELKAVEKGDHVSAARHTQTPTDRNQD